MSTTTLNAAVVAGRPGLIRQIIAWLNRRAAARADQGVWHNGARGM